MALRCAEAVGGVATLCRADSLSIQSFVSQVVRTAILLFDGSVSDPILLPTVWQGAVRFPHGSSALRFAGERADTSDRPRAYREPTVGEAAGEPPGSTIRLRRTDGDQAR